MLIVMHTTFSHMTRKIYFRKFSLKVLKVVQQQLKGSTHTHTQSGPLFGLQMKSVAKLAAPSQQYCSETSLRHAPHSDMNTNLMLWSIYMLFLVCMLFMSLTKWFVFIWSFTDTIGRQVCTEILQIEQEWQSPHGQSPYGSQMCQLYLRAKKMWQTVSVLHQSEHCLRQERPNTVHQNKKSSPSLTISYCLCLMKVQMLLCYDNQFPPLFDETANTTLLRLLSTSVWTQRGNWVVIICTGC